MIDLDAVGREADRQLTLFDQTQLIEQINLHDYDLIIINSSAGKDSLAMLITLYRMAIEQNYPLDRIIVQYNPLGDRVTWPGTANIGPNAAPLLAVFGDQPGTAELAALQAEMLGLRLVTSGRKSKKYPGERDLLDHIERHGRFPNSSNRFCTGEHKTGPGNRTVTDEYQQLDVRGRIPRLLYTLGYRADESARRRGFSPFNPDARSNTMRAVDEWYPIHSWPDDKVWSVIHASGMPYHWAYRAGMRRLSCSFCLAGETEVVTRDGIRPIAELAGGRHRLLVPKKTPYGLSGHGTFVEAEVRPFGVQRLWRIDMHRGRQQRTVYATAEHRWLLSIAGKRSGDLTTIERTTADLKVGDRLRSLTAQPVIGAQQINQMPFAVAQGFVYGDGTKGCGDRPASLTIYNPDKDGALLPYFAMHERREVIANGAPAIYIYGLPRLWKEAPDLRESRAFLMSWLAGYFAADGCVSTQGSAKISSSRRESLHIVREIAAICGVGYGPVRREMRVGKGKKVSALYTLTIDATRLPSWFFLIEEHRRRIQERTPGREAGTRPWVVGSVQPTDRVEEVYCAVVPGIEAFALTEDLMTGNCVLAGGEDLALAAALRPDVALEYARVEAANVAIGLATGDTKGRLFQEGKKRKDGTISSRSMTDIIRAARQHPAITQLGLNTTLLDDFLRRGGRSA